MENESLTFSEKNSMRKKNKDYNFFERIFMYSIILVRGNKLPIDEQIGRLLLVVMNLLALIVGIVVLVYNIFLKTYLWETVIVVSIYEGILIANIVVVYYIFNLFQLFLFVFCASSTVIITASHFLLYKSGILGGSCIMFAPMFSLLSLYYGRFFNKFFFNMVIICCLSVCLIWDSFTFNLNIFVINNHSKTPFMFVFFFYFYIMVILIATCVLMWQLTSRGDSTNKLIDTVGKSLLALDFEKPEIHKFLQKKPIFFSKAEKLLYEMTKNLKSYLSFLPDDLKKTANVKQNSESNKSEEESDTSDETEKSGDEWNKNAKTKVLGKGKNENYSGDLKSTGSGGKTTENGSTIEYLGDGIPQGNLEYSFKKTDSTQLCITIPQGAFEKMLLGNAHYIYTIMRTFLDVVKQNVDREKGVIGDIMSNRIYSYFNTGNNRLQDHAKGACECAQKILSLMTKSKKVVTFPLALCVRRFPMCVNGFVKAKDISRVFIFSPDIRVDSLFLDVSERRNAVVSDFQTAKEVALHYETKQIDLIYRPPVIPHEMPSSVSGKEVTPTGTLTKNEEMSVFPNSEVTSPPSSINIGSYHEVFMIQSKSEKEWFDMLASSHFENNSEFDEYSKAWSLFKQKKYEEALKSIKQYEVIHKQNFEKLKSTNEEISSKTYIEDIDANYLKTTLQSLIPDSNKNTNTNTNTNTNSK